MIKEDVDFQRIVNEAVEAADKIIMDRTDGSIEMTNALTAAVTVRFAIKSSYRIIHYTLERFS